MKIRDDIHFALACLAVLTERLPNTEAFIVLGMMEQLLDINRAVSGKDPVDPEVSVLSIARSIKTRPIKIDPDQIWPDYMRACEMMTREMYIYIDRHGHPPAAVYATYGLLGILQRGHSLVANAGKGETFNGIPILPCGGKGQMFHFAQEVFELPKTIETEEEPE